MPAYVSADEDSVMLGGTVTAVSRSSAYTLSKWNEPAIWLIAGVDGYGDVHAGATVKHRSRARRDSTTPNLRQVHLMPAELHDELTESGFAVEAGGLGEGTVVTGGEVRPGDST
jgi:hypothetical protein